MSEKHFRRHKYRAFLYFYQNGRCAYCLKEMRLSFEGGHAKGNVATLDHVKPASKKGKTTWDNLILCCYSCNHDKGSKSITPAFPPLEPLPLGNGQGYYKGLGSQVFHVDFIKQTALRIYEAPQSYAVETPLHFPTDLVQSTVSQAILKKR
jgi:hypothetical protein